jgi:hypothetical protein
MKQKHVPVALTVAAVGVGVGIGVWLMRERILKLAREARMSGRNTDDPLDVFGSDVPAHAFEGVSNHPYMPEGWRPRRGSRD